MVMKLLFTIGTLGVPVFLLLYAAILLIREAITSRAVRNRMRRRITSDLGRESQEIDLGSIATWMKVDEAEEKKGNVGYRVLVPKSVDDYVTLIDLGILMDSSRRSIIPIPLTLMDLPTRLFQIKYDSKKGKKTF
jgi:hypothetical protein